MTLSSKCRSGASDVRSIRRPIVTPQHHDTRQRLQRTVVTFGIDHADTVALQDHLLAAKPGNPGFAGLWVSDD